MITPPRPRARAEIPPVTLPAAGVAQAVRARLMHALRSARTIAELRTHAVELASDLEAAESFEDAPDTERAPTGYPAPWEGDVAPPTPRESDLGREYGCE